MLEVRQKGDGNIKKGGSIPIQCNSSELQVEVGYIYYRSFVIVYKCYSWRINVNIDKLSNFVPLLYCFQCDRIRSRNGHLCIWHNKSVLSSILLMQFSVQSKEITESFWQISFQLIIQELTISNYYNAFKFILSTQLLLVDL